MSLSKVIVWANNIIDNERMCREEFKRALENGQHITQITKLEYYEILLDRYTDFTSAFAQLEMVKEDLGQFFALISGGYYKAAILVLRSHFEAYITASKFIKDDNTLQKLNESREGKNRHFKHNGLASKGSTLKAEIETLWSDISKYAHGTGKGKSFDLNNELPLPIYDEKRVKQCLDYLERVIDCGVGVFVLCMSDKSKKQDLLKNIFGQDFAKTAEEKIYEDQTLEYLRHNMRNPNILE